MGPGFRRDCGFLQFPQLQSRAAYCSGRKAMTDIRKIVTLREVVFSELGHAASRPVVHAVGIGVIRNPFAGRWAEDLRPVFEAGAALGERLMPELVRMLDGPAVSYGKGALVGVAGELE